MTTHSFDLHKAIYEALQDHAPLMSLVRGVFDHVPDSATLPYLTVRPATARPWSTKTSRGEDITYVVDIWSEAAGRHEALTLMSVVTTRLGEVDLMLDGADLVLLRHEFSELFTDADGETLHGVLRFRALVNEKL